MSELKFTIGSGVAILSDPCYKKGTWCAKIVPARNGEWTVEPNKLFEGGRMASFIAKHVDYETIKHGGRATVDDLDVDSGQFGIFDAAKYPTARTSANTISPTRSMASAVRLRSATTAAGSSTTSAS
jgi:hypothetical protein